MVVRDTHVQTRELQRVLLDDAELPPAARRALAVMRAEQPGTGSGWLFYVGVTPHACGAEGSFWILVTLGVLLPLIPLRLPSFPFLPPPALPSCRCPCTCSVPHSCLPTPIPEVPPNRPRVCPKVSVLPQAEPERLPRAGNRSRYSER